MLLSIQNAKSVMEVDFLQLGLTDHEIGRKGESKIA